MENTASKGKLNFHGQCRQLSVKALNSVKTKGKQNLIITGAMIVLIIIFFLFNTYFLNKYNIVSMAQSLAPYAILALGVTFVIATGLIDLSIGTVCIACAVLAGKLHMSGMPLGLVIPVMLVVGTLFGWLNGLMVAKLKMPAFIATLGTMMFARGISAIIVTVPNISFPAGTWYNKLFSNFNDFPIGLIWIVVLAAICMFVMYKTKIGRYILAIGSNEEAARLSGIHTDRYKALAFTICGLFAGIAAIFYSASFATISSASGNGMELDAIAGVYIGGTSATGGIASIAGSVIGSAILVILRNGLNLVLGKFNVSINPTYLTYVITGIVVVIAVLMDVIKNKNLSKVKTEKKADKFRKQISEEIEAIRVNMDYIRSDKNLTSQEAVTALNSAKDEISELKAKRNAELPALIEEDRIRVEQVKELKRKLREQTHKKAE